MPIIYHSDITNEENSTTYVYHPMVWLLLHVKSTVMPTYHLTDCQRATNKNIWLYIPLSLNRVYLVLHHEWRIFSHLCSSLSRSSLDERRGIFRLCSPTNFSPWSSIGTWQCTRYSEKQSWRITRNHSIVFLQISVWNASIQTLFGVSKCGE
jgi:hypothetical protein